jgi:glycine hydroxymethyltransferase|tara:strand:+ start:1137 stop:2378 length:1242 start_codon:yes stop_codon:yes gene_type:complete
MSALLNTDPEIADAINREESRQSTVLEMIASENYASKAVLEAVGSVLTNKYAEGYPGARYYNGNSVLDDVERLARSRAKDLFGADHANLQPHSGAQANLAAYLALLNPGDTVMGLKLDSGGHLTHGSPVNASGRIYNFVSYEVDKESHLVDYEAMLTQAKITRPKLIIVGATAYPRVWDFERARQIADEVGAVLLADIAHISGLIAAKVHPTPVGSAQVITSSTHKTLRGPRGGIILCDEDYRKKINSGVFPGTQGGPMMHVIAGKAVMLKEANTIEFRNYAQQVVINAQHLAAHLVDSGFNLVTGGTDNHLLLLDIRDRGVTGREAANALEKAGIVCNFNSVPFDDRPVREGGGIRLGTPAITSRGLDTEHMSLVAGWITRALHDINNEGELEAISQEIKTLLDEFPTPGIT